MQKNDEINFASYNSFIKYMGLSRNPLKALQVYDSIPDNSMKVNVSVCNSILGCVVRNGRFQSSIKLFDQMKDDGLSPDLVTYSSLLEGCTKLKDGYSKAMQVVNELKDNGLHMDNVIYGNLLAICASNNLCEEAEVFFQQMKNEGYTPNLFHYSSLLNAYSEDGNYVKAEMLMEDMKSLGLVPSKVILTTLLKVYAKGGLFEKSWELLAELEASGYAEDEMPYCLLMDNLAKSGHIHEAKEIFSQMKDKDVKSGTSLIFQLGRAGSPSEALYVYNMLRHSKRRPCKTLHEKILHILVAAGLLKEAYVVMKDNADLIPVHSLEKFAIAFMKSGNINSINDVLKAFNRSGLHNMHGGFSYGYITLYYKTREERPALATAGMDVWAGICCGLIIHQGTCSSETLIFLVRNRS